MNLPQAIILSIIEGITEFLPISSTAHLVLAANIMRIPETEFVKTFQVFIQLGAILAVVLLYYKTLVKNRQMWGKIVLAFLPTGVLGLIFYKIVKTFLIGNIQLTLIALLSGGFILVLLEKFYHEKVKHLSHEETMTWWQAVTIGIFQSISMIPGVSRSAATISGGIMLGLSREAAVEFSFLLAIPTMLAASSFDLIQSFRIFTPHEFILLIVGFSGSFLSAIIGVKAFVNFIKNHTFIPFGFYRIILVISFLIFMTAEKTSSISDLVIEKTATPSMSFSPRETLITTVPILTYHYIGLNSNPKDTLRFGLSVTPDNFDAQMAYLKGKGYTTITLDDLKQIFDGATTPPVKSVVLTFDDGYVDFFVNAYPILKKYNFKATAFIPTGLMNQGYYLSWEQIKEMAGSGLIDFEDHTVSHPDLTKLSYSVALKQFSDSRRKLQEETGQKVNFMAYPSGKYNETVLKAVEDAGFVGAVTTKYGFSSEVNLTMPRISINGYTTQSSFEAKIKTSF